MDSYGDGMCCGYGEGSYSILVGDSPVASGGDFEESASHTFCAPAGACVQISIIADSYPGEINWSLSVIDGGTAVPVLGQDNGSTATYDVDPSNCSTVIVGCTDVTACNYDAQATLDDGSC